MKNLAWAVAFLIVIIVAIFIFASSGSEEPPVSESFVGEKEATKSDIVITETDDTMINPFELLKKDQISNQQVRLSTDKGDIVIEMYDDSPLAASNFLDLVGKKFYDGLTFHRREEGFVIQGGDPNGDGTGGPGYKFDDEEVTRDYLKGTVAMANSGPNTNGSQFFIMLDDVPSLPKQYTIFGNVIEGIEVVDNISIGDVISKAIIAPSK